MKALLSLDVDGILATIERVIATYDKEELHESAEALGIAPAALAVLDGVSPPIPYPYYFCTAAWLQEHPPLVTYYRNIAMLSRKEMNGIGLNTEAYEQNSAIPAAEVADELARFFNKIVSQLITLGGVTQQRHIEMAFANLGGSDEMTIFLGCD